MQPSAPTSPTKDYGPNVKILKTNGNIRDMQTVLRDKTTTMGDFKFYADRLIRLVVEEGLNQLPYTACEVTTPTGRRRRDGVVEKQEEQRVVVISRQNLLDYHAVVLLQLLGHRYEGLKYIHGNCGVSIMRSGEAMEQVRLKYELDHVAQCMHPSIQSTVLMASFICTHSLAPNKWVARSFFSSARYNLFANAFAVYIQGLRDVCRSIRIGKILIQTQEDTQEPKVFYAKFPPDVEQRRVLLMYPIMSTGQFNNW